MTLPPPNRIEWIGPERWTVWVDEDGPHLRSRGGDRLESVDVARLFDIWQAARDAHASGTPVPVPTTPDLPF